MKMEGHISQGKLVSSKASIYDLVRHREMSTDSRVTEMTSLMRKLDRQADDRKKSDLDLKQRRDADVNNLMMELMAAVKDLTLGVKTVVTQPAVPPSFPPLFPPRLSRRMFHQLVRFVRNHKGLGK